MTGARTPGARIVETWSGRRIREAVDGSAPHGTMGNLAYCIDAHITHIDAHITHIRQMWMRRAEKAETDLSSARRALAEKERECTRLADLREAMLDANGAQQRVEEIKRYVQEWLASEPSPDQYAMTAEEAAILLAHIDALTDHVIKLEARSLSFDRVEARLTEAAERIVELEILAKGWQQDWDDQVAETKLAEQRAAVLEAAIQELIAYGVASHIQAGLEAVLSPAPKEEK